MKILLIHGWLHTTDILKSLQEDLSMHEITLWYIHGLDDNTYVSKEDMYSSLEKHLLVNRYDLIVAHSYGCNILLNVKLKLVSTNVVLLNPVYNNFKWYIDISISLMYLGLPIIKKIYLKYGLCWFIKLLASFTCNNKELIDYKLLLGFTKSNLGTLSEILDIQKWEINLYCNKYIIVHSLKDKLLNKPVELLQKLSCDYYEVSHGHTSFLEDKDEVLSIVFGGLK